MIIFDWYRDEDGALFFLGKSLNLALFGDGGIDCVMSDELCDEFGTNHFGRVLAFAVRIFVGWKIVDIFGCVRFDFG